MKQEVPLPLPPKDHPPAFVLGGDKDLIVDVQALTESAEVYGVQPVILKNAAHDIMLVSSHSYVQRKRGLPVQIVVDLLCSLFPCAPL